MRCGTAHDIAHTLFSGPTSELRHTVEIGHFPPSSRPQYLSRPDLIALLNGCPKHRLILICATAGYGKSTLTAQWLSQVSTPRIWITLDANDDILRPFILQIVTAMRSIEQEFGDATEQLLSSVGLLPPEVVIRQLIADLSAITQNFVLVLDDFQSVESPEILQSMNLLLDHLPETMQIVLISRTDPPLRLARFRANGELFEIREQNLAFSRSETKQFYKARFDLDLTSGEAQQVHELTEGWVAGLQLIGIAYRGTPHRRGQQAFDVPPSDSRFAGEYLWTEVFQRQPDDIRAFLLRTSILDRFAAGLCDAVTGQQHSEEMIRRCERDNLFVIPLDGVGAWYRYHQLFADFLRNRLAQTITEEERFDLHLRASRWFESAGYIEDAVRHAIAGQRWERAAELLEQECHTYFELDYIAVLRDRLQGLPAQIFERSPQLAFWLSWAFNRIGKWQEAAQPFHIAEKAWTDANDQAGLGSLLLWKACFGFDRRKKIILAEQALDLLPPDRAAERLFAYSVQAQSYVHLGQPEKAEPLFAEQRSLAAAAGFSWFQLQEMSHSAGALIQRGKLHEASILCRQVIQAVGDTPIELWVHAALCRYGSIFLEWDQLNDASEHLRRADMLSELANSLMWKVRISVGLARIAWARGQREEALGSLELGLASATQMGNLQEERIIKAWQARFWLASRQFDLVRQWASDYGWEVSQSPDYEHQVEYLTYVRFLIRDRRPELALSVLTAFGELAEATGRQGDMVEISLLAAMAHAGSGDNAKALSSLRHSLNLGYPNGYVRLYIDEGQELAPLLRREVLRSEHRAFAQRLLSEIEGGGMPEPTNNIDQTFDLSEREVEVLRLAATGMPNREIGVRLFISEATVKRHMNHLLRKLGAANRIQATQQAREIGLL
jgi:LuxR family maltose regulon positive regulatory protein